MFAFALFGVSIVGLLAGRTFWAKMHRNGLIRLEEADGEGALKDERRPNLGKLGSIEGRCCNGFWEDFSYMAPLNVLLPSPS